MPRVGRLRSLPEAGFGRKKRGLRMTTACEPANKGAAVLRPCQSLSIGSCRETELDLKLSLSFSIRGWDVANPIWRKAMNHKKQRFTRMHKRNAVAAALTLLMPVIAGVAVTGATVQARTANTEKQMNPTPSKFYCNTKALTPEERAHHKQLSEKLMAARKAIVETDRGYEFQFGPQDATLAELADWVVAESKCCPFFDFHIDLENEGKLICLRLTGEEGIKQFIRAEFPAK